MYYKLIAPMLYHKSGYKITVSQIEYSDELKSKLQDLGVLQDYLWRSTGWYYLNFHHTNDYSKHFRIEGTKRELQDIVDMLNVAIHSAEKYE